MPTKTLTLTDFLLARIAEDEREAFDVHNWHDCDRDYPCVCGRPARIEAECEAKRRIVAMHVRAEDVYDGDGIERPGAGCAACWDDYPCDTIKALALPHADHPDFREEWRA